jgi:hypothetical protein
MFKRHFGAIGGLSALGVVFAIVSQSDWKAAEFPQEPKLKVADGYCELRKDADGALKKAIIRDVDENFVRFAMIDRSLTDEFSGRAGKPYKVRAGEFIGQYRYEDVGHFVVEENKCVVNGVAYPVELVRY